MKNFMPRESFSIYNGVCECFMDVFFSKDLSTCNSFECEMGRFFFIDKGIHMQYWK
jgi:hypothetical protein